MSVASTAKYDWERRNWRPSGQSTRTIGITSINRAHMQSPSRGRHSMYIKMKLTENFFNKIAFSLVGYVLNCIKTDKTMRKTKRKICPRQKCVFKCRMLSWLLFLYSSKILQYMLHLHPTILSNYCFLNWPRMVLHRGLFKHWGTRESTG